MRSRKACAVIMAPNIEQDEDEGRLDGLLAGLLGQAASYGIPVVYALSRKKLGLVRLLPNPYPVIPMLGQTASYGIQVVYALSRKKLGLVRLLPIP